MLSGIGPAAHLKEVGISAAIDLPGVGQNLQDHMISGIASLCSQNITFNSAETLSNHYYYEFPGQGHGIMRSDRCGLEIGLQFLEDPASEPLV